MRKVLAILLLGAGVAVASPADDEEAVRLDLRSAPDSEVLIDGVLVGRTPLVHRTTRRDKSLEVTFRAPGHTPVTKYVVATRGQKLQVILKRKTP
jgi:hypothetical protein